MRSALTAICLAIALMACTPKPEPTAAPAAAATETPATAASQTNVAKDGEMCGGIAGIQCGDGHYCAMEVGQCRIADASGTCKTIPDMCTEEYNPVCGCDDTTYSNACKAASVGVNVSAPGECPKG